MSEAATTVRKPRFNHVAMTVPADLLEQKGRDQILDFYSEVFGWSEMPGLTQDRQRFVLRCYSNEQFVFLTAGDGRPMECGRMDHFGMSVGTPEELDGMLARARKYQEKDPRVEIVDRHTDDYKVVKLHNFYVRFLLPLMVEVQCYEWAEGLDDQSEPAAPS